MGKKLIEDDSGLLDQCFVLSLEGFFETIDEDRELLSFGAFQLGKKSGGPFKAGPVREKVTWMDLQRLQSGNRLLDLTF